jgi:hypothetical protein
VGVRGDWWTGCEDAIKSFLRRMGTKRLLRLVVVCMPLEKRNDRPLRIMEWRSSFNSRPDVTTAHLQEGRGCGALPRTSLPKETCFGPVTGRARYFPAPAPRGRRRQAPTTSGSAAARRASSRRRPSPSRPASRDRGGGESAAAAHGASVMTGVPPAAHRPSGSLLPGGLTMADSGAGLGPAYRPVRVAPAMRMEVITSHDSRRFEQVHDRVRQAHERIASCVLRWGPSCAAPGWCR